MRSRTKMSAVIVVVLAMGVASQVFSNNRTTDPIGVAVSPQTLVLSVDQGGAVTVHTAVPYPSVVAGSLTLNGIPADATWADNRGNAVARFNEKAVESIVAPPSAVLTLSGMYTSGGSFSGSDTVRVIK